MAAIITEKYRKNLASLLQDDFASNNYYIGLGKSDSWYEPLGSNIAPFPRGTSADNQYVQDALTDLIKIDVSDITRVIPLVTLANGTRYKQYDPHDASCLYPSTINDIVYKPAYFVDMSSGNVYIFIKSPSASSVSITSTDLDNVARGFVDYTYIDGVDTITTQAEIFALGAYHIVAKVGTIVQYSTFNNEQFVEISTSLRADAPYKGALYGFSVINGGTWAGSLNATLNATIEFNGKTNDGADVAVDIPATITVANGVCTAVTVIDDYRIQDLNEGTPESFKCGTCSLIVDTAPTTAPVLAPCIAAKNGFAYDVAEYTPSWYVGFLVNSRSSSHLVYSSYAQASLIRNPKDTSDNLLTAATVSTLNSFTLESYDTSGNNLVGQVITQDSKLIGIVNSSYYDSIAGDTTVYYTNSVKYGYDTPSGSLPIILDGTSTTVNPTNITATSYDHGSGEVLFIDNRASITRSEDQNEEIKIIIQL